MKYLVEMNFGYDIGTKIFDSLAEAESYCEYDIRHTTKEELKISSWYIYEVANRYAERFQSYDIDLECYADITSPVKSYDNFEEE